MILQVDVEANFSSDISRIQTFHLFKWPSIPRMSRVFREHNNAHSSPDGDSNLVCNRFRIPDYCANKSQLAEAVQTQSCANSFAFDFLCWGSHTWGDECCVANFITCAQEGLCAATGGQTLGIGGLGGQIFRRDLHARLARKGFRSSFVDKLRSLYGATSADVIVMHDSALSGGHSESALVHCGC